MGKAAKRTKNCRNLRMLGWSVRKLVKKYSPSTGGKVVARGWVKFQLGLS